MEQKYYLFDQVFSQSSIAYQMKANFVGAEKREDGKYIIRFNIFQASGYSGGSSIMEYVAAPGDEMRLGFGTEICYSRRVNGKLGETQKSDHCVIRAVDTNWLELEFEEKR